MDLERDDDAGHEILPALAGQHIAQKALIAPVLRGATAIHVRFRVFNPGIPYRLLVLLSDIHQPASWLVQPVKVAQHGCLAYRFERFNIAQHHGVQIEIQQVAGYCVAE